MNSDRPPIDLLFVSELPLWPLDQGYRVHGCQMAQALSRLGVRVRLASMSPTPPDAPAWLRQLLLEWPDSTLEDVACIERGWSGLAGPLRRRVARHQGVDPVDLAPLVALVRRHQPAAVVALGQHGPLMLRGLKSVAQLPKTIWYAADDPVYFQLSCLWREGPESCRSRLHMAGVYALMHTLFARRLDGVIGVSPQERLRLGFWTRSPHAITIRNGVDLDFYTPAGPDQAGLSSPTYTAAASDRDSPSCVFWGRMDFEPNIDAVRWFAAAVWPHLRWRFSNARWSIVGKHPTPEVRQLARIPGIQIQGAVEDIRLPARNAWATVLPMRCGGGIKNKLLEAAAMGLPIVASHRAVRGLELPGDPPMLLCRRPAEWITSLSRLWTDPGLRMSLGRSARHWVEQHHHWNAAALRLVDVVNSMLPAQRRIHPAQDPIPLEPAQAQAA